MTRRLAGHATALVLSTAGLLAAIPTTAHAAPAGGGVEVSYRGYHLTVPADWQVVDLEANPRACVRQDRKTVYLGLPGDSQDCPPHLVADRADTLLVTPERSTDTPAATVRPGAEVPASVVRAGAAGREFTVSVEGTGLRVTAGYRDSADAVRQVLAGGRTDGTAAAAPASRQPRSLAQAPAAQAPAAQTLTAQAPVAKTTPSTEVNGLAFDACTAPSSSAMNAWSASPYRTVGVYIGGPLRGCAQPNLTAAWVDQQASAGWSFLPIYVGRQANSAYSLQIDANEATARQQGIDAAADAVQQAQTLGFKPGAVLYNDMENYVSSTSKARVLAFLGGWTDRVHLSNFRSGVYSSANSGVADLAAKYTDPNYPSPDVIWSAVWNGTADTSDQAMNLPGSQYWTANRVHQYAGNVSETYNGVTINIDRNAVDVRGPQVNAGNQLKAGWKLGSGQSLTSTDVTVVMQADGNLVAYLKSNGSSAGGAVIWSSNTYGNPGAYAQMQYDGNLVVYRADGSMATGGAVWSSGTWGNSGARVVLQEDGNLVIYRQDGSAAWATGTYRAGRTFTAGAALSGGQWARGPVDSLVMHSDGNLVIYRLDGSVAWSTGTWNSPGAYLLMQSDGNMVLYARGGGPATGGAIWSSRTWGNPGARAVLQDDGNLVIYRQDGSAAWASGTWQV
ncbi:glycoside hydrolase domain-containing protein [Kitasatospora sp. NPDC051853]|uniref:glycoside hydrolase domain-containing protein n=1 Tax=Kitasatospora sp. NPDC051853 TaxID=3364058 RepID=UPI0037904D24